MSADGRSSTPSDRSVGQAYLLYAMLAHTGNNSVAVLPDLFPAGGSP